MQPYVHVVTYSSPCAPGLQEGLAKNKRSLYQRLAHRNESKLFKVLLLSEK